MSDNKKRRWDSKPGPQELKNEPTNPFKSWVKLVCPFECSNSLYLYVTTE